MIRIKKPIIIVLSIALPFILSSCATAPIRPSIIPTKEVYPHATLPVLRQDVFHIVAPGETLWRISKMYDVPIKDILSANNLKTGAIEKGQASQEVSDISYFWLVISKNIILLSLEFTGFCWHYYC